MTPFEGTSTCIETARPLQLLEVLSSVCALVFLSSRSLTSLQTSGGPLTSSRITPDSLLPFVHPPPLSSNLCVGLVVPHLLFQLRFQIPLPLGLNRIPPQEPLSLAV